MDISTDPGPIVICPVCGAFQAGELSTTGWIVWIIGIGGQVADSSSANACPVFSQYGAGNGEAKALRALASSAIGVSGHIVACLVGLDI